MTLKFQFHAEGIYDAVQSYKLRAAKYGKENGTESLKRMSELIRGLDSIHGANWASKALLEQTTFQVVAGINWTKRNKIGGMFEHAHPIVETRNYLIEHDLTLEQTIEYLWNEYAICWITYEENDRLNALKYSKARPGGWQKCYAEAGIEPVKL